MLGSLLRMGDTKFSCRFTAVVSASDAPIPLLKRLLQVTAGLVTKPVFDTAWVQMGLCVLSFARGVVEQSARWCEAIIQDHRSGLPAGTIIDLGKVDIKDAHATTSSAGGEKRSETDRGSEDSTTDARFSDLGKHVWRLCVALLQCTELQLERLPQGRAGYVLEKIGDLRDVIVSNMRRLQLSMGPDWARFHRAIFPCLLRQSIRLKEKSALVCRFFKKKLAFFCICVCMCVCVCVCVV